MRLNFATIPAELIERRQWVLWSQVSRDGKPTKVPFQTNRTAAKTTDPATWTTFAEAQAAYSSGGFSGVGYVFAADDPFCGIDLDGCRNAETGEVAEWAKAIINRFGSYAEVSPSQTGVKIFCRGKSPLATGRKKVLSKVPRVQDKEPAIEIYDERRYFAVTGFHLAGLAGVTDAQDALDWLKGTYFADEPQRSTQADFRSHAAVIDRARKYLAKLPPAISGQNGHGATFRAACVLVLGFGLGEADALGLLREYNEVCEPRWTERELVHKIESAAKQPGQRGYLRDAAPANWPKIRVPDYQEPAPPQPQAEPRITTLVDAAKAYIETVRAGNTNLIDVGISELDYALAGGVEKGEMVIFAARPSHGKSAVALQCVHHWTGLGKPCAIISEEMSAMMLGKRTMQFVSEVHQEHWKDTLWRLEEEIDEYAEGHAVCHVLERCGTSYVAVAAIERLVKDHGVECVVVDYAQLLRSAGKNRYEQVTNTSVMLRQLASAQKIVLLVLCQLNRDIVSRPIFIPNMADLKDSGQLEQDADVITFLVWPWKMDANEDRRKFQFFVEKNRNRPINERAVTCQFIAERQRVSESIPDIPAQLLNAPREQRDSIR